jgi:hypothetical protein
VNFRGWDEAKGTKEARMTGRRRTLGYKRETTANRESRLGDRGVGVEERGGGQRSYGSTGSGSEHR